MTQTNSKRREVSGVLIQSFVQFYEVDAETLCMAIGDFQSMAVRWLGSFNPEVPPQTQTEEAPAREEKPRRTRKEKVEKQEEKVEEKEPESVPPVSSEAMQDEPETPPSGKAEETQPAVDGEAPAVTVYDPASKEHKTILASILKSNHAFNLNNPLHSKAASSINASIAGVPMDDKFADVVKYYVGKTPQF